MGPDARETQLLKEELERVLSSASFARTERLSKLLRFVVERHVEGRDDELKESLIGVEVFGRRADYDPKLDSTVRTEAVRLRARLSKYYSTEGSGNALIIELPKGGYVPRWRLRPAVRERRGTRGVWLAVGLASVIVAVAVVGMRVVWAHQVPVPIAVLPLVNLSEDVGSDVFVDGLTDEIIREASDIPGVIVRSRTSSFTFKGRPTTIADAGSRLDVQYIIEGSVARSGIEIRATARLVRVRDDVPLWTGTFNREVRDALTTQHEISRGVVNALQFKLGRGLRRYDTDAFDLYLRGRSAGDAGFPGNDEAVGLLEQAIAKDPSIAPAYAGLAVAYAWRSFRSPIDPRRAEELDKMRAAAKRAVQLDERLPEAQSALATAFARDAQWNLAERSFRHAIDLDPSLPTTHDLFARFVLWPLGRIDEAAREALAGLENDPQSLWARYELADVLLSAGRYDEAAKYCDQLPREFPPGAECRGRARLAQGRTAEAIEAFAADATNNWGYLAYAYAKQGRREEAKAVMAAAVTRYPNRPGSFQYALAYAGLRDQDHTIEQLQRMSAVGAVRIGFTLNSPEFTFLAPDPRVRVLRKQVGLPE